MKEVVICISMGLVGHLIVFRGIDPAALVHNIALWSIVGISLGLISHVSTLLFPFRRRGHSVVQQHKDLM